MHTAQLSRGLETSRLDARARYRGDGGCSCCRALRAGWGSSRGPAFAGAEACRQPWAVRPGAGTCSTARHCSPDAARPLRSAAPQEARRQVKGGARTFGPYRGARLLPQEARGRPPPWSLAEPTERPAAREALDQVRVRCSQGDRSTCRSLFCPPCSPRLPSTPRLMCALLTGRYALTSLRNPFLNRKGRMQQTQGMKWTTACQTVCRLTAERNRSPNATPLRVSPAGRVLGRAG